MTHKDHVNLIKKAVTPGVWADLGSGDGAFTLALADLLDSKSKIYSVDKDKSRLTVQQQEFTRLFPKIQIEFIHQDFTQPLDIPVLDGILMANSLHYIKNKESFLKNILANLKPSGKFILVEYNVDSGNTWVPYPLSYETFKQIAKTAGLLHIEFLSWVKSDFLNEIYAASGMKK
jgi:ubiquinone/menaquinone biosynthesis C-methylase UbiE